jgi:tight adherence protein C
MSQSAPILIAFLAFGAVAVLVFLVGQYIWTQARLQQRLPISGQSLEVGPSSPSSGAFSAFVARHFSEQQYGVDETLRGKLRRDLIKAGYFRRDALNFYIFARISLVIALPILAYILIELFLGSIEWYLKLIIVAVSALLAIAGPDAYVARRQRLLARRYQQVFPDFLDLLVVCVDAGLSLEGALGRVTGEIIKQCHELGMNLMIMEAEMRAGRSTIEALESLAERLTVDEARSLVVMLRQSLELGSDVGEALRVFSDEMRDKRTLRAEETANKLPVKMVGPMALFIFPVILMLIMLPLALRVINVLPR